MFHSRSEFPLRDPNLQDSRVGKVSTPTGDSSIPGESSPKLHLRRGLPDGRSCAGSSVVKGLSPDVCYLLRSTISAVPRHLIVERRERIEAAKCTAVGISQQPPIHNCLRFCSLLHYKIWHRYRSEANGTRRRQTALGGKRQYHDITITYNILRQRVKTNPFNYL